MEFGERQLPGDGTLAAVFTCPGCGREMAMLTNPMETRLVSSMGVKIGGREVPEQPMELLRSNLEGANDEALVDPMEPPPPPRSGRPEWTSAAVERLENVPRFVRGMVKRIYTDYAKERGIPEITPEVMDRARSDLGLEGM
jgi:hypothetical protein